MLIRLVAFTKTTDNVICMEFVAYSNIARIHLYGRRESDIKILYTIVILKIKVESPYCKVKILFGIIYLNDVWKN